MNPNWHITAYKAWWLILYHNALRGPLLNPSFKIMVAFDLFGSEVPLKTGPDTRTGDSGAAMTNLINYINLRYTKNMECPELISSPGWANPTIYR